MRSRTLVFLGMVLAVVATGGIPSPIAAQTGAEIWEGTLETPVGPLRVEVHLTRNASGDTAAELVSVDQGNTRIPIETFSIEDGSMSFSVPMVGGEFRGTLNDAGDVADGIWTQELELPLRLTRRAAVD